MADETTPTTVPASSNAPDMPESGTAGDQPYQEVLDAAREAEQAVASAVAGMAALNKQPS